MDGLRWSWGPQFASQSDVTVGSLIGNLTKDVSEVLGIVVNRMPVSLVPFRYLITYLTWSICDFEGLCVYLARMLVIVAMSGRVEIASHVKHPIYCCIVCCSFRWAWSDRLEGSGIESTG